MARLVLVDAPAPATPAGRRDRLPAGHRPADCAQSVQSGRADFTGWLSSSEAIDAAHQGRARRWCSWANPVFYESAGIAFDNTVADNDSSVAAVNTILDEMRADGTLLTLSQKWFDGLDLVSGQ